MNRKRIDDANLTEAAADDNRWVNYDEFNVDHCGLKVNIGFTAALSGYMYKAQFLVDSSVTKEDLVTLQTSE